MELILNLIGPYVNLIESGFMILGVLVVIATVIVKLTPSAADDEKLDKIVVYIQKLMAYMPTIGVNPRTKKLYEWYEEQKAPPSNAEKK